MEKPIFALKPTEILSRARRAAWRREPRLARTSISSNPIALSHGNGSIYRAGPVPLGRGRQMAPEPSLHPNASPRADHFNRTLAR